MYDNNQRCRLRYSYRYTAAPRLVDKRLCHSLVSSLFHGLAAPSSIAANCNGSLTSSGLFSPLPARDKLLLRLMA